MKYVELKTLGILALSALLLPSSPIQAQESNAADLLLDCYQKAESINLGVQPNLSFLVPCNQLIDQFESANQIDRPKYSDLERISALLNRSIILTELTEFERATADLNQALAIDPSSAELYINRAVLQMLQAEYQDAIQDFSLALEIAPLSPLALFNRALAYNYLGELELAIADLYSLQLEHPEQYTLWVTQESLPSLFALLPELITGPEVEPTAE